MTNLTLDVGNTRTKIAAYTDNDLVFTETVPYLTIPYLKKIPYNHKNSNCILSVTGSVTADIEKYLEKKFKNFTILSHDTPVPIKNLYATPATLGRDRLAAVVGAYALFAGEHCLVIDAGTCITYDFLDAEGAYHGGNIAPGLQMRLRAMHKFTERLPLVEMREQETPLGNDTESALRNGAQYGALLEVRGYIGKYRRKYRHLNVLFTGGDADFFVKQLKSRIFARPNLVSLGLNQILNYNVE